MPPPFGIKDDRSNGERLAYVRIGEDYVDFGFSFPRLNGVGRAILSEVTQVKT